MPSISKLVPAATGVTPLCGSCRGHDRCRLGIGDFEPDGDRLRAPVVCAAFFHAGPRIAHGGWTAAVFDDVMGRSLAQRGLLTVTGSLTVDFLKPVPVEEPMTVEVTVEGRDGRRIALAAALFLSGDAAPLARARGIWVERRNDHFERHESALAEHRAARAQADD